MTTRLVASVDTMTISVGEILWHGTSAREGFRDLRGPAWLSDSRAVAVEFVEWHTGGGSSRILKYEVTSEIELPAIDSQEEWDRFAREITIVNAGLDPSEFDLDDEYVLDEVGLTVENSPTEFAQIVCDLGLPGWNIRNNYPSGADIMICEPERYLRRVKAGRERAP